MPPSITPRNLTASTGMVFTSAFMGGAPLALNRGHSALLTAGIMRLFIIALTALVTLALYWPALRTPANWTRTLAMARSKDIALTAVSYTDFPLLVWAMRLTALATAAAMTAAAAAGGQTPTTSDIAGITMATAAAITTAFTGFTWTWANTCAKAPGNDRRFAEVAGAPAELYFMLA